jgi:hypothetical protein
MFVHNLEQENIGRRNVILNFQVCFFILDGVLL